MYGVGHSALQKCLPCCRLKASKLENDVLFFEYIELKVKDYSAVKLNSVLMMMMMMMNDQMKTAILEVAVK